MYIVFNNAFTMGEGWVSATISLFFPGFRDSQTLYNAGLNDNIFRFRVFLGNARARQIWNALGEG